jgi:hypothetical protein
MKSCNRVRMSIEHVICSQHADALFFFLFFDRNLAGKNDSGGLFAFANLGFLNRESVCGSAIGGFGSDASMLPTTISER